MSEQEKASESHEAVSPPGWKKTVEKMKEHPEIDNPWALAWWEKGKGAHPHYKEKSAADEFARAIVVESVANKFAKRHSGSRG
jgi:hypothetical protein